MNTFLYDLFLFPKSKTKEKNTSQLRSLIIVLQTKFDQGPRKLNSTTKCGYLLVTFFSKLFHLTTKTTLAHCKKFRECRKHKIESEDVYSPKPYPSDGRVCCELLDFFLCLCKSCLSVYSRNYTNK